MRSLHLESVIPNNGKRQAKEIHTKPAIDSRTLYVPDLEGTLLTPNGCLSPRTLSVLGVLIGCGIRLPMRLPAGTAAFVKKRLGRLFASCVLTENRL